MEVSMTSDQWLAVAEALESGQVTFSTGTMEPSADGLAQWIVNNLDEKDETTLLFDWDGYTMVMQARDYLNEQE